MSGIIGGNISSLSNTTTLTTVNPMHTNALSILRILKSNFLAISILNTILNIVAVLLDVCALKGITSARNFSEGTRVFLVNMTILDLITAITLQPTFTAYLLVWIQNTTASAPILPLLFKIFNALHYIMTISSFLSFLAVSLDRYLLIFFPFAYCNFMSTKIAVSVCCLLNLPAIVSFTILRFYATEQHNELQYLNIIMYIIVALLILIHGRIMLTARSMHKRIRQCSIVEAKQTVLRRRRVELKQAGVTFGLFLTIVVCFMPIIVVQSIMNNTGGVSDVTTGLALYWSVFIMLVCPILKQVLLCVLNSAIRAAIRKWFFGEEMPEEILAMRSVRHTYHHSHPTVRFSAQVVATCFKPLSKRGRILSTLTESDLNCTAPVENEVTRDVIATPGSTVLIPCGGKRRRYAAWQRGGFNLPRNRRFNVKDDGTLRILSVRHADIGVYECLLKNGYGSVIVKVKLTLADRESLPKFLEKYDSMEAISGNAAQLKCRVDGYPRPTVTWKKEGTTVSNDVRHKFLPHGDLEIMPVRPRDHGYYTCEARNSIGSISHTTRVVVKGL
eukprot:gene17765-19539_t